MPREAEPCSARSFFVLSVLSRCCRRKKTYHCVGACRPLRRVHGDGLLLHHGVDVRFGSEADSCSAATHVRCTPNSDRESRHPQTVMSAFPLKADVCGASGHVCYGPIADMRKNRKTASRLPLRSP